MQTETSRTLQSELAARFLRIRAATENLAKGLSAEDCAIQSMPDASPVKWHLAHTTWFFETFVLAPNLRAYRPFDPAYRVLFNSYYNAVGEKHPRPERGMLSRPGLDEVRSYRRHVDQAMHRLLGETPRLPGTGGVDRAGRPPRATAPGIDPHRPEAPSVAQSAPAGVPETLAAHADPRARARLDRLSRADCRKSGTQAADSASTTRRRAIASGWSRSASPRIRSRTATSSSSSTTAATAGPSCGSRPGGIS